ncbi:CIR protein, partial [Plasmodium chabaudi chabaudi]
MDNEACKLFRKVNANFNKEIVDVDKFNQFTESHPFCPYEQIGKKKKLRDCNNNYERINAIGGYLRSQLSRIKNDIQTRENNDNQYIEYMLIWLSNILLQISKDHNSILEASYKTHLEKHMGNYNYWNILGNKRYLKDGNISYMSQFYKLFDQICNIINEYNTNGATSKNLGKFSTECFQTYTKIYNAINRCGPYMNLLKNLKTTYDNFRGSVISADKTNTLNKVIQELKPEIKIDSSANGFGDECKKAHSNAEKISLKDQPKVPPQGTPKGKQQGASKDTPPGKQQGGSTGTSKDPSKGTPQGPQKGTSPGTPKGTSPGTPQKPGGSPPINKGPQTTPSGGTASKLQTPASPGQTLSQSVGAGAPPSASGSGTDPLGGKKGVVSDPQSKPDIKGGGQKDAGRSSPTNPGAQLKQSGDTTLKPQIQNSPDSTPSQPAGAGTPPSTPGSGTDPPGSKQKAVDDSQNKGMTKGSGQTDTGSGAGNQKGLQTDPTKPVDPT